MLLTLWDTFEKELGRPVDLLTDQPIENPILKETVERTKVLIYDRHNPQIPA